jgi:DNA replication protein DnaC
VSRHENVSLVGPTGVSEGWLACALARADGSVRNLLARLSRVNVLVVDDLAMAQMPEAERRGFWKVCEERYHTRSTILTSQVLNSLVA